MNDIIQAMKDRRSIRRFKPDLPPQTLLDQILEAGLYAPSARGQQPVITIAVTDPALRARLAADNCRIGGWEPDFDPFYGAPAVLIVLADQTAPNRVYDGSLVMGNLMLAAHALGLGSIWIHRAREEFELPEYQKLLRELGITGTWEGIGHCAIGYIEGTPSAPAPRRANRLYYV